MPDYPHLGPMNPYVNRAKVVSVYDGDTITIDVDLGRDIWVMGEKIRLAGINTPELRGGDREAGLRARDHLRSLIEGKQITIQTIKSKRTKRDKKGKYGRYLAIVWLQNEDGVWLNINQKMVVDGFATKY